MPKPTISPSQGLEDLATDVETSDPNNAFFNQVRLAESHLESVVEELLTVGVHPGVELLLKLAGRGVVVPSQPNCRSVQRVGTKCSGSKCREEIKFRKKVYKGLSHEIDFKKFYKNFQNFHNPLDNGKQGQIPEEIYQTLLTNKKQGNLD
jgi:hypothetical protein